MAVGRPSPRPSPLRGEGEISMKSATGSRALLMAWLAAEDEPGRDGVLAHEFLALALSGPSYGGDRHAEAGVQRALLGLAAALGRRAEAWATAAEAELARGGDAEEPLDVRVARLREAVGLARRGEAW